MPKYTNSFKRSDYREEQILDRGGRLLGTLRIKPSSILWKSRVARDFASVSLDSFVQWIENPVTSASRVCK